MNSKLKSLSVVLLIIIVILCIVFIYKTGNFNTSKSSLNDQSINGVLPEIIDEKPLIKDETKQVVCTMDAKMCADGSYVSRTGPDCEFAQCPAYMPPIDGAPTHELNQTYEYDGIKITPLKIIDDSRCPAGVMCIWEGQLIVLTKLEASIGAKSGSGIPGPMEKIITEEVKLKMHESYNFAGKSVTLTGGNMNDNPNRAFSFEVK